MKTTLVALTAIAALTFTPRSAHALGDKEAALLGGLLGGVIIGAAINDAFDDDYVEVHHYGSKHRGHDYSHSYHRGSSCPPRYGHGRGRDYGHSYGGYWSYRTVKVWVPKRVWYSYDDCGRRVKHYKRGYWTHRKEKVWVERRGRW